MQIEISDHDNSVIKKLAEIEAEMKRIDYWDTSPPVFNTTNFLDAPSFELWLQCVFIPNAWQAAKTSQYPQHSEVGVMAMRQYNYHNHDQQAQTLLRLLKELDQLINLPQSNEVN